MHTPFSKSWEYFFKFTGNCNAHTLKTGCALDNATCLPTPLQITFVGSQWAVPFFFPCGSPLGLGCYKVRRSWVRQWRASPASRERRKNQSHPHLQIPQPGVGEPHLQWGRAPSYLSCSPHFSQPAGQRQGEREGNKREATGLLQRHRLGSWEGRGLSPIEERALLPQAVVAGGGGWSALPPPSPCWHAVVLCNGQAVYFVFAATKWLSLSTATLIFLL